MKKYLLIFLSILMIFPFPIYAEEIVEDSTTEVILDPNTFVVTLSACVDGDTARFKTAEDEIIKARFLAIDTPESVHPTIGEEKYGKEASNYTCEVLTNATEIKLEYDDGSDKEDNYGRQLVWVFIDGVLLQNSLVSKGYAEVAYLYGDYKYTSVLQESEKVAKLNKLGIWSIEEEKDSVTDSIEEKVEEVEEDFISKIVDMLFAKILDYINEILESILNYIEEVL